MEEVILRHRYHNKHKYPLMLSFLRIKHIEGTLIIQVFFIIVKNYEN